MKKYQKKPVVIEALQFTGFNPKEVQEFVGDNCEIFYFNKTDRENGAKLPFVAVAILLGISDYMDSKEGKDI